MSADKRDSGALVSVPGWEECFDGPIGAFFFTRVKHPADGSVRDTLVVKLPGNHPLNEDGASPIPIDLTRWSFDGNRAAPTISPSVHVVGHWHGFIRAGRYESC